ncbi:hypothetical protein CcaverHIS002_0101180 [Cutaneotrichosporon cavernicola]|nr:hypothetical protein CcaverHIS002_0101180 [Cutaneotrichosporon cavernicola]BEI95166.1 hypothetical protein CcaverHIS631_0101150 [Cutaneotrichosporon cavernicola]BEJ02940.1 hypothetical protein CcaverHIS641_0101150 [Cutaneotrichosporon cavernicola]
MPYPAHRPYSAPAPAPLPLWTPNVFYSRGSLVWYAGRVWRCDTPHTSGDLAREPTESLHLWTPVGSNLVSTFNGYNSPPSYHHGTPPHLPARPQTAPASTERIRSRALLEDTDASRKAAYLQEELSGARVWRVGGVGVFAYAEDVRAERVRQAAWREWSATNGSDEWLHAARLRTAKYITAHEQGRLRPLVRWHLVEGNGSLPMDALPVGREASGAVLYSARAWLGGGVEIGKCGMHIRGGSAFTYGGEELDVPFFEVLCGPPDVVEWVSFERGATANLPGWQPVEGARDRMTLRAVLIARATHEGGLQPCKCLVDDDHACIPSGGQESWVTPFEVLTYAAMFRR